MDTRHFTFRRRLLTVPTEEITAAAAAADGYSDTLCRLGFKPSSNNYALLRERLEQTGMDVDHFLGRSWVRVSQPNGRARPLDAILVQGGTSCSSTLKERLLREDVLP